MVRRCLKSLSIVICASLVFALGCRTAARTFIFPGQRRANAGHLSGFIEHRLIASDGVAVRVLELQAGREGRVVVHFHNNRETAEQGVDVARELGARGLDVFLVEYRGYGLAPDAAPSEAGLYADAEAALDMISSRGVTPERIVLWGTSLGTGVAVEMARRGRGGRLVLVTPYTSIPDLVTGVVPFLPAGLLIADHFDTLIKAPTIAIPTIVVHGDADEIVPFRMGERVTAAIPGARLLRVAGGHHGDLLHRAHIGIVDAIAGLPGAEARIVARAR